MAINQDLPIPARSIKPNRVDVGKALKLRLQGVTLPDIAALQGVTKQAIYQALTRFEPFLASIEPGQLTAFAEERGQILNSVELGLMQSLVDPAKVERASLRDIAVTYGIVYDKRRLESGQSTSNTMLLGKLIVQTELKLGSSSVAGQPAAGPLSEPGTKPVRGKIRTRKQK